MASQNLSPDQLKAYQQAFTHFDVNKDGVISIKELRNIGQHMGYRLTDAQIAQLMDTYDMDKNGCLTFEEFVMAMSGTPQCICDDDHHMAGIRIKFQEYDSDGNGTVSAQEAHAILSKELDFSPKQTAVLVARYDKDGDGNLSYEEFAKFFMALNKVRAKTDQMKALFEKCDIDSSGSISVVEAKEMLSKLGMCEHEIETMVSIYDKNRDGELQYEEFVNFLTHRQ